MGRVRAVPRLGRTRGVPGTQEHSRGVSESRHALEVVQQKDEGVLGTDGAARHRRVLAIHLTGRGAVWGVGSGSGRLFFRYGSEHFIHCCPAGCKNGLVYPYNVQGTMMHEYHYLYEYFQSEIESPYSTFYIVYTS